MDFSPMLELHNSSKSFPGVKALKNVDFALYPGEIIGVAGENGAGKSTLIKILSGVHHPEEGTIEVFGKRHRILNTHASIGLGISVTYQELSLVPELSVAENLYLGAVPSKAGTITSKELYEKSNQILKTLGLNIDPREKVATLSISTQQLVEIGKSLARNAKILILDEPTSSLGRDEAHRLFETMRNLRDKGYGIIFISHRLDELLEITDRIMVLRDGEHVETRATGDWTVDSLVFAMVNRKIDKYYPKRPIEIGDTVLSAVNLENKHIKNVSFSLRAGEIVGVSGLMGAGRTELIKTIYGVYGLKKGHIELNGRKCTIKSPRQALSYGIAMVPENRKEEGLILEGSIKENVILSVLKKASQFFVIKRKNINKLGSEAVRFFNINTPSANKKVSKLSGGNQQKTVFARVSETDPKILLLDEPTRGVDIGAKVEIYNKILDFAEKGAAILFSSSDLPEILGITDRVLVMREREMVAELKTEEVDSKIIMDYATGGK